jgi:Caspase domain/WD domain, G-beta repeat
MTSTEPILTLNTGMHTAMINRISTDARGRHLLTASDDKTAKLWDLTDGTLLRTFRPPIGDGDEGKLYAGAISPDGRTVAVGGWTKAGSSSHNIYLFEAATGVLLRRITGLPNVIFDLEFSPDGRFLAASLWGKNGIRIYRSSDWGLQAQDTDYGADSYNIAFDAWGRMASVCYDGYLRLYDADFKLLKKTALTGGKQPYSLAFSPNGQLLAVGYSDSPTVQVLDATTGVLRYAPDVSGANAIDDHLNKVAFSADGLRLAAGGFFSKQKEGTWWHQIRIWSEAGKGSYTDIDAGQNTILDIKSLPNGDFAYGSAQPNWGTVDAVGSHRRLYVESDLLDFAASNKSHFRLGNSGEEVGATPFNKPPLRFEVPSRWLSETASNSPAAATERGGLRLSDWNANTDPKLNGKSFALLQNYEVSFSSAIATGGVGIALGTNWTIYCTDARGIKQWEQPTLATAWCVNIDPGNQVVAAGLGDGTIRWYRFLDGKPLLTLYIHPDRQRWVLWTPSGYFDCAPGAEELLGWHLNRGPDREAEYYPLSKFRDKYYRPDVIDRILEYYDEGVALEEADKARGRTTTRATALDELPPTVRILSPSEGSEGSSTRLTLAYSITSTNNEPVTAVRILVDGRPVATGRGFKPLGKRIEETIEVPAANCTVSVVAENRFGASEPAAVRLIWKGASPVPVVGGVDIRPKLYVLAIGVSDYQHTEIGSLDYADDDARAFAAFFNEQKGSPSSIYADVQTKVLLDSDATKEHILDGLEWLEKETTSRDVAMLFFAGHGVDDRNGNFFFLPATADPNALKRTGVAHGDVQTTVQSVAGKIIVFMDACHAGGLMKPITATRGNPLPEIAPVVNELISAENGAIVFCSTTNRQKALEDAQWGHGAFTKALLEGLGGQAVAPGTKKVTVKTLDAFVAERVKTLTNRQQTPTTAYPPNVPDFPVSLGN